MDVRLVFVSEVAQRGQYGVGARLAQAAQGGFLDDARELLERRDVLRLAPSLADLLEDLQQPARALAAGGALAAGLVLNEIHEEARHVHHAGVLVHDDRAARAHDGAHLGDGLVVHGDVQVLLRHAAAAEDRPAGPP